MFNITKSIQSFTLIIHISLYTSTCPASLATFERRIDYIRDEYSKVLKCRNRKSSQRQMDRMTALRKMLDEVFCPLLMDIVRPKKNNSKPVVKGNEMDVDIKAAVIHVPTLQELLMDECPQDSNGYHGLEEADDDDANYHTPGFISPSSRNFSHNDFSSNDDAACDKATQTQLCPCPPLQTL